MVLTTKTLDICPLANSSEGDRRDESPILELRVGFFLCLRSAGYTYPQIRAFSFFIVKVISLAVDDTNACVYDMRKILLGAGHPSAEHFRNLVGEL